MKKIIFTLVFFLLFTSIVLEPVFAQRGGRGGGAAGGQPPRRGGGGSGGRAGAAIQPLGPEGPQTLQDAIIHGTAPDMEGVSGSSDIEILPFSTSPGTGQIVPAKVIRFAGWFLEKHDKNNDDALQYEEWLSLPGSPQVIDIDGDKIITLDEIVRYIAKYGSERTLHRPNPPVKAYTPQVAAAEYQLFKPLSAPLKSPDQKKKTTEPGTESTEGDVTEEDVNTIPEEIVEDETEIVEIEEESTEPEEDEDITFEYILGDGKTTAEKTYYRPIAELKGVPAWFISRDKDGDGQLSLLEFAPNLTSQGLALFGKLDLNGDGFITDEEVVQATSQKP